MTPFRRPRTQHRIATALLLFWLFALGASWANACVLQDRLTHAHVSASGEEPEAPTVMAGHRGAVPSHDVDAGAGDSACLDLCDAATQSCVQQDSTPGAIDLADGPPLELVLAWMPDASGRASSPVGDPPRPPDAVPPRTLFSRLAL